MIFNVESQDAGKRLDVFLQEKFPEVTRSYIKKLIEDEKVSLNGKFVKAGEKLRGGDQISIEFSAPEEIEATPENIPLDIRYEDDDLAVINKPQGMVVHAGAGNANGTLVNALLYNLKNLSGINGKLRPGIVHRLDKNTSGLLLVAKNDFAHHSLASQIEKKTCHRNYLAVLEGSLKAEEGRIVTNIARDKKHRTLMNVCPEGEGKLAITDYKVVKNYEGYSLVEFALQTGRTHQIRVHASRVLHHPIVGDREYNPSTKLDGQLLHAYKIEFSHPRTGERITVEAELPEPFKAFLKKLKEV